MSLPLRFYGERRVKDNSLRLSYRFEDTMIGAKDTIQGKELDTRMLHGDIPSTRYALSTPTAQVALSLSFKDKTSLFTFSSIHLTKWFPSRLGVSPPPMAVVLEGVHNMNANNEKILVFIPMTKLAAGTPNSSLFASLENELKESTQSPVDINALIPSLPISYYKHTDKSVNYHIVFFDQSSLKYTVVEAPDFYSTTSTPPPYPSISTEIPILYLSVDLPVQRNTLSESFQDNIYIDCVPVDLMEKPKDYLQLNVNSSNMAYNPRSFIDLLLVFAYILLLIAMVYGLYKLGMWVSSMSRSKASPPAASPGLSGPRTGS